MRWIWILLLALTGISAGYAITRFEGTPPQIAAVEGPIWIGKLREETVRVTDADMGVASVRAWIESGGDRFELAEETYPGNIFLGAALPDVQRALSLRIEPESLGLRDGQATLHVEALDYSWRGNRSHHETELQIDSTPPRVSVRTGLTYVRRGGAEAVVYRIDEEVERHGVEIGEEFFRGFPHPQSPELKVALYAIQYDAPADAEPRVVAVDRAGNRAAVGIRVEVIERRFQTDEIRLTEGFMRRKAEELGGATNDGVLAAYLKINGDMRRKNAKRIREICSNSSDEPLWSGPFMQLPNSRVGANFAERRTYSYEGRPVDEQIHLGFDLASISRAPVPAANDGVVAFAGDLGIYGQTVILDHGLGLFTLYGHLSEIAVVRGAAVARGEQLGRTGTTGLAGGDHLHFSTLIGGVFVDPLEWFDERWIRDHLQPKFAAPARADASG